jgi:hypothetical protein
MGWKYTKRKGCDGEFARKGKGRGEKPLSLFGGQKRESNGDREIVRERAAVDRGVSKIAFVNGKKDLRWQIRSRKKRTTK